jgi:cold shock CspA family protein
MSTAMIFIDGTWLYSTTPKLAEDCGVTDLTLDYGLLPKVAANQVSLQMGISGPDVVRTFLFGSYAVNYDLRDDELVQRRIDFFNMLREEFHYETELFTINFRGRRLRKKDRDPNDDFEPKEKCVDIALAANMLFYAAIPHAYDIAVAVVGDRDYLPVLQSVRRLGKRVAIVSAKDSCAPEYSDPYDKSRVKDTDIIWLNDLIPDIELKYERRQVECQSPLHAGDRKVWTTYRPRKGQPFYCNDCRRKFSDQKALAQREYVAGGTENMVESYQAVYCGCSGEIKSLKEKGFGFIRGDNAQDYYFHLTDLDGIEWDELVPGMKVDFEIKKEPTLDKAGAAGRVRPAS